MFFYSNDKKKINDSNTDNNDEVVISNDAADAPPTPCAADDVPEIYSNPFPRIECECEEQQDAQKQQQYHEKQYHNYSYPHSYLRSGKIADPMMSTLPVLYIKELVSDRETQSSSGRNNTPVDWRMYIFYDADSNQYVLNGTRRQHSDHYLTIYPDVCMYFSSRKTLAFYLRKSMCTWNHKSNITMYAMSRSVIYLSTPGAIPNFHSIHNCRSKFITELFGYDDCKLTTRKINSYLKVLRDGNGHMMKY